MEAFTAAHGIFFFKFGITIATRNLGSASTDGRPPAPVGGVRPKVGHNLPDLGGLIAPDLRVHITFWGYDLHRSSKTLDIV